MKSVLAVVVAVAGIAGGPTVISATENGTEQPNSDSVLVFDAPKASFGDTYQFGVVEHLYHFKNSGVVDVEIGTIDSRRHAIVEVNPRVIRPGESGTVSVKQPLGPSLGISTFRYVVNTDESGVKPVALSLQGFVQSAYLPEGTTVELGDIDRTLGGSRSVEMTCREVADFRMTEIESAPDFVDVIQESPDGSDPQVVRLRLSVSPGAPLGTLSGLVVIRTNVEHQPRYVLEVSGTVNGDVVPDPGRVEFGLVRSGESVTKEVTLRSRGRAPFKIERVDSTGGDVETTVVPCPDEAECSRLQVEKRGISLGNFGGILKVFLTGSEEPIPIAYSGLVIHPDTVVHTLGEVGEGGGTVASDGRVITGNNSEPEMTPADPSSTPEISRVSDGESPAVKDPQARLRWTVKDEDHIHGFLVYRAENRAGPFLRLNDAVIRVQDDGESTHTYVYQDFEVIPEKTYYYYVDLVTRTGLKGQLTGVVSKRVEQSPETE